MLLLAFSYHSACFCYSFVLCLAFAKVSFSITLAAFSNCLGNFSMFFPFTMIVELLLALFILANVLQIVASFLLLFCF